MSGPFPFTRDDLEADRLLAGARHTLDSFRQWRDDNPGAVASHVDRYTDQLKAITSHRRRPVWPGRRRGYSYRAISRDIAYFVAYNLGEIPDSATVTRIVEALQHRHPSIDDLIAGLGASRQVTGVTDLLGQHLPGLRDTPELRWLTERLDRLHRILPESVVQAGGMGKVLRAMLGVLAIGAHETLGADPEAGVSADSTGAVAEHLASILPAAYALGAAYVIVDDTLQDLPADHIPRAERELSHRLIIKGLSTGAPIDVDEIPDHPLAEELHGLYELLLERHPFTSWRHLYQAAEAMYLAQDRDSARTIEEVAGSGVEALYPDILLKSGLSRVIANIIGRREFDDACYARCLNAVVVGQFKDDLRDRTEDALAGRVTPFTVPFDPAGVNPLYDLFAYDAYVAAEVFDGAEAAADALTYFGAVKLASHLSADGQDAADLIRGYDATSEIARCLRAASTLPGEVARRLEPVETRIKDHCGSALRHRDPATVDARTFVSDRLPIINQITRQCCARDNPTGLDAIIAYAMDAPGKRLRPALGLMLAEALGAQIASIEPFVAASELFHTASLMFDDLPAQDNAIVRRGRPTAHTVFDEGSVQLAAVSMISTGFGLLSRLAEWYPPLRVTEVIAYVGTVLGPDRLCRGQDLDLHMSRADQPPTGTDILTMYELKTSTSIEAALVPLMMLLGRPAAETELLRQYARHAGIVFQIRDDILDLTSSTEYLGKDADNDVNKVNVVRVFGLAEAQRLMRTHLDDALTCCSALPFDTNLLAGMVEHFARRRR